MVHGENVRYTQITDAIQEGIVVLDPSIGTCSTSSIHSIPLHYGYILTQAD